MLRGTILDIRNQSYKNICHSINVCLDHNSNLDLIPKVFYDLIDECLVISYHRNEHQHTNHIKAILEVDGWEEYDIFVKIDDDDIYKKDYVKTIVQYFEKNDVDVVSSVMAYQINGKFLRKGSYHNLGANPEMCDFKMPATFAFNLKALKQILELNNLYAFEDNMWRDIWCKKSVIGEVDNTENVLWHIHGKNTTTSDFLIEREK